MKILKTREKDASRETKESEEEEVAGESKKVLFSF